MGACERVRDDDNDMSTGISLPTYASALQPKRPTLLMRPVYEQPVVTRAIDNNRSPCSTPSHSLCLSLSPSCFHPFRVPPLVLAERRHSTWDVTYPQGYFFPIRAWIS